MSPTRLSISLPSGSTSSKRSSLPSTESHVPLPDSSPRHNPFLPVFASNSPSPLLTLSPSIIELAFNYSYQTRTNTSVWTSLTSMFVITVAVLSKAQPKQSGRFVFTDFENFSGWENNVIAFITGFINANYSFSCLDAATHISEEIPRPEVNIPKALLTIPVIGVLSSLFYNISMVRSLVPCVWFLE